VTLKTSCFPSYKAPLLLSFRRYVHPHVYFGLIVGFLGLSWLAVVLLDFLNVGGAGEWFLFSGSVLILDNSQTLYGTPAPFFHVWFQNGSVIEWLQWTCLATVGVMGTWLGSDLRESEYDTARFFWLLLGIGALLMLIEDAGDPRHAMIGFVSLLYPVLPGGFPIETFFELFIYFPLLAALPLYALFRYYRVVKQIALVAPYLWVGFAFYGTAAVFSASSGIGDWYLVAGDAMMFLVSDHLVAAETGMRVNFYLMDSLVEESIELVGAAGLLSATVAQYRAAFLDVNVPNERASAKVIN